MRAEVPEREHGLWTQQKGDREALAVMRMMRGSDDERIAEGMGEFIQLCRLHGA